MRDITTNYCKDCQWQVDREHRSSNEMAELAIEHCLQEGHDIGSIVFDEDSPSGTVIY